VDFQRLASVLFGPLRALTFQSPQLALQGHLYGVWARTVANRKLFDLEFKIIIAQFNK
jgi:hypothetical protein